MQHARQIDRFQHGPLMQIRTSYRFGMLSKSISCNMGGVSAACVANWDPLRDVRARHCTEGFDEVLEVRRSPPQALSANP